MRNISSHSFSQVPKAEIQRSTFDRSCNRKTTFDAGYLIPTFVDEVLPGDTFNLSETHFARLATPLTPYMDNIYLTSFYFFVPYRLIWSNWEEFNGAQANPNSSTDFVIPQQVSPVGGYAAQSLQDYMGIRPLIAGMTHSALPLRAYNLIWNEWFRDQNLQNSITVDTGNGPDTVTNYVLQKRGKRHDYFTSALPWPQKGPSVELPLGTEAPVIGIGKRTQVYPSTNSLNYETDGTGTVTYAKAARVGDTDGAADQQFFVEEDPNHAGYPNIRADLSAATAATINAIRQAFQIQRLYERDARGGTRYTEIIRSHFGVVSPDARLQRPEYLGGGTSHLNSTPVAQTTPTSGGSTPLGNLAAFGVSSSTGNGFTKSFTEHGVIIGIMCATADLTYQQGLNRMWSRRTRFDFFWPALAHLGEQAVLNKEIFVQGTSDDENVFGYQERYAEYRYKPSELTGLFRSDVAGTLDIWHLSQDFASLPSLNASFIEENPPIDRIIAVPSQPHIIMDMNFNLRTARPMPTYGVPGLIDHF